MIKLKTISQNLKPNNKKNEGTCYKLHVTRSEGQALIGVLAIVAISSVVVASLVINSLIIADFSLRLRQSTSLLNQTDTALHNAILRLERDPTYTGETLNFELGQAIIEITENNPKIITAKSITSDDKIIRKLQVEVNFETNGVATVDNWVELN